MLRWRLLLGFCIVVLFVGLCWLDNYATIPGIYLMPVAILAILFASHELLDLFAKANLYPIRWLVYLGNVAIPVCIWLSAGTHYGYGLPPVYYLTLYLPALEYRAPFLSSMWLFPMMMLLVLLAEMIRYRSPGKSIVHSAAAVFAIGYIGVTLSFAIMMRNTVGIGALAAWIIVVKMGDTGAYTVGRLFGRHKMAPLISPGKTVEGAVGALLFSCVGSWLAFQCFVPFTVYNANDSLPDSSRGWLIFGLLVGAAGMLGDLAESLLKRDAGMKDSSRWLPGFGGVLDMLDSLLLSAPVAWFCWASGLVGR